jgi:hypothetical protein
MTRIQHHFKIPFARPFLIEAARDVIEGRDDGSQFDEALTLVEMPGLREFFAELQARDGTILPRIAGRDIWLDEI